MRALEGFQSIEGDHAALTNDLRRWMSEVAALKNKIPDVYPISKGADSGHSQKGCMMTVINAAAICLGVTQLT